MQDEEQERAARSDFNSCFTPIPFVCVGEENLTNLDIWHKTNQKVKKKKKLYTSLSLSYLLWTFTSWCLNSNHQILYIFFLNNKYQPNWSSSIFQSSSPILHLPESCQWHSLYVPTNQFGVEHPSFIPLLSCTWWCCCCCCWCQMPHHLFHMLAQTPLA